MSDPMARPPMPGPMGIPQIIPQPGGGVRVVYPEDTSDPQAQIDAQHDDNLAEIIDETVLEKIGTEIGTLVEEDEKGSEDWRQIYKKGIEQLGYDRKSDTRTVPFPGASNAVHPVLAEACTDFGSRVIKELFPAGGPVKVKLVGASTSVEAARAERVRVHMNMQLTREMPEYRPELESMLSQLPLVGMTVKKVYYDTVLGRPRSDFILPECFIAPYEAVDTATAPRLTDKLTVSHGDVQRFQLQGLWRKTDLPPAPVAITEPDDSPRKSSDAISGVKPSTDQFDKQSRIVYETHIDYDVPGFEDTDITGAPTGLLLPWIITVDKASKKVLSVRRNWKPTDSLKRKRQYFVCYRFVPWRGFYSIGLLHLIGGLERAATGALRALLDAAQIQNMPGGAKLKGAKISGGTSQLNPLEWTEIESATDDIRKSMIPTPINGPSAVLFELMKFCAEAGTRFASVANQVVADASNEGPVGTTLALLEQGSNIYSAIHARLHVSQTEEFRLLSEINYETLDDERIVEVYGKPIVTRADYGPPVQVVPVSDPSIFSETQRVAQAQTAYTMATAAPPGMYDRRAVELMLLTALRIPDVDRLLPEPPKAQPMDPAGEFFAILKGMPVDAFPEQDHAAHMGFIMATMMDPQYAPVLPAIAPQMQALLAQHAALLRRAEVEQALGIRLPPPGQQMPPAIAQSIAQKQAQVAQQLAAQRKDQMPGMPGGPADPAMVMAQAAQADVARKAERDKKDIAMQGAELLTKARMDHEKNVTQETIARERNETQVKTARDSTSSSERTAAFKGLQGHVTQQQKSADTRFVTLNKPKPKPSGGAA